MFQFKNPVKNRLNSCFSNIETQCLFLLTHMRTNQIKVMVIARDCETKQNSFVL